VEQGTSASIEKIDGCKDKFVKAAQTLIYADSLLQKVALHKLTRKKRLRASLRKLNKFCSKGKCGDAINEIASLMVGEGDSCDIVDLVYSLHGSGYYRGNPGHVNSLLK